MGRKIFPENQPFVCGGARRALSSEARWVGTSVNGAAGIRLCDLRCPESAGNLRPLDAGTGGRERGIGNRVEWGERRAGGGPGGRWFGLFGSVV